MNLDKNCCKKVAAAFAEWQYAVEDAMEDVNKVLNVYLEIEQKHYEEDERDDHIYLTLSKLREFHDMVGVWNEE
tara:strand:- start:216 stop:437 length:222 start_codon:yes stop_codon:yes gene_type:complete